MNRKRIINLLPWVLCVAAIAGCAVREVMWQKREAITIGMEQRLRKVMLASSEAEEQSALGQLAKWMQSKNFGLLLDAYDPRTGKRIPFEAVLVEGTIFELSIRNAGDSELDHWYQMVLKNPNNISILMQE